MRFPGRLALAVLVVGVALVLARYAGIGLRPPPQIADRRYELALPEGRALRLAVLGTSLSRDETWPEAVAERLRGALGVPVTLSVVASNGAGSDWGLTQAGVIAEVQPDLLLVEFAINDADVTDGRSLREAARLHAALVAELRAAAPGTAIALMTMSPAQGLRGLARPRLRAHYLQYRALAEDLGLGLIDLYPRWLALPRDARGLSADGLHPDPETATRLIAPVVAGSIECALSGDACAPGPDPLSAGRE